MKTITIFMKNLCLLHFLVLFPLLAKAQVTLIPDRNFEQRLIDSNIDSDGIINGQILTSDAQVATKLSLGSSQIDDLTGLNSFINLEELNCYYTPLNGYVGPPYGTIDVSTMLNLKEIDVRSAHLNTIDLSNNILLEKVYIGNEIMYNTKPAPPFVPIINDFKDWI